MKFAHKRAELLGVDLKDVWKAAMDQYLDEFVGLGNYDSIPKKQGFWFRERDLSTCLMFVSMCNVGYGRNENLKDYCGQAALIAEDCIYGDFERVFFEPSLNVNLESDELHWVSVFRTGVFFGLVNCDESTVDRLAQWIQPSFPLDEKGDEVTQYDNLYFKILAARLCDASWSASELESKIVNSSNTRATQLMKALNAIFEHNESGFEKHLNDHLRRYLKAELPKQDLDSYMSIDGSTLWHLAEREGLSLPKLEPKHSALIVTKDSISAISQ